MPYSVLGLWPAETFGIDFHRVPDSQFALKAKNRL